MNQFPPSLADVNNPPATTGLVSEISNTSVAADNVSGNKVYFFQFVFSWVFMNCVQVMRWLSVCVKSAVWVYCGNVKLPSPVDKNHQMSMTGDIPSVYKK
jgi:hypothetical protein